MSRMGFISEFLPIAHAAWLAAQKRPGFRWWLLLERGFGHARVVP